MLATIIIFALIAAYAGFIVIKGIRKLKRGESGCGCGCSDCSKSTE
jgi:hypothetical protein